ncbi:glutaredoxin family protein [Arcanobacterium bovis]|uniref:NrdH-redoxin n=1 Tax=Arcanobacterium bovis TaxID=2529275 RepID=A0A4Q9V038_9ACTO|nr:NrdH-redoxin [Arcanobacterium bovis]
MKQQEEVIVGTNPGCGPCIATKRWLAKNSISFREVDLQSSFGQELASKAIKAGMKTAPVIFTTSYEPLFCGFQPTKLAQLRPVITPTPGQTVQVSINR